MSTKKKLTKDEYSHFTERLLIHFDPGTGKAKCKRRVKNLSKNIDEVTCKICKGEPLK